MTIQDWLGEGNRIGIDIWENKYRYREESFDAWLDRVSGGDAEVRELIRQKKFLFAGRILAGRGVAHRERKLSLSNCYVAEPPEDSLESIYDCARDMARTYSYGGGCGVDISKLAPRGAVIHNAAKQTSGAVSFMELFAMSTALIGQHGRRGALMISIDGRHPDLIDFIDAKKDLTKLTKANTSIRIHDDFMRAVENGEPYTLRYTREATGEVITRSVDARQTFRRIAENNWDTGEPGVLFWDRVSSWNLLSADPAYRYAGVNPCAEEPLPANGACLLGSLNLSDFVTEEGFDFPSFTAAVGVAVRALNQVLDEGFDAHPLPAQAEQARRWRQIGLGVFGVADMCIRLGFAYGSEEARELCDCIGDAMINAALQTSALLARDNGTYPAYNAEAVRASDFYRLNADTETRRLVARYGLRNSQLLTIPPTGTTSTMLGVSNGIEPIFALSYTRKTESLQDRDAYYSTFTPSVARWMREHGITDAKELPDFISHSTAGELDFRDRLAMQAVWQTHVDASISSTVNLPHSATVDDVEQVYLQAWKRNLKGVTVFRDGCRRAGILTTDNTKREAPDSPHPGALPRTMRGATTRASIPCGELSVTVNANECEPCQLLVTPGSGGGCRAQSLALSNMVTLALRCGIPSELVVEQLKGIRCPAAARKSNLTAVSCPDAMGQALEAFGAEGTPAEKAEEAPEQAQEEADLCPVCHTPFTHNGGCVTCLNCGYSHCG